MDFQEIEDIEINAAEKITYQSFRNNKVAIDEEKFDKAKNLLLNNRFCLIRGAPGRGKTALAVCIGYHLKAQESLEVLYGEAAFLRMDFMLDRIRGVDELRATTYLCIIENCHRKFEEISRLLRELISKNGTAKFLFTTRKILPKDLRDADEEYFFSALQKYRVDLRPRKAHMVRIIDQHVANLLTHDKYKESKIEVADEEKELLARELYKKGSIDLKRLDLYFRAWDPSEKKLSEVNDDDVCKHLAGVRKLNEEETAEALLRISAIYQFEVPVKVNFMNPFFKALSTVDKLVAEGDIQKDEKGDFKLEDAKDAFWLLRSAEYWNKLGGSIENYTSNVLVEYIKTKPLNFQELLKSIYIEPDDFWNQARKKKLIHSMLKDEGAFSSLKELVQGKNLPDIYEALRIIKWADREKAKEVWKDYKNARGIKDIQKELNKSSLSVIYLFLNNLENIQFEDLIIFASNLNVTHTVAEVQKTTGFGEIARFIEQLSRIATLAKDRGFTEAAKIQEKLNSIIDNKAYGARKLGEQARESRANMLSILTIINAATNNHDIAREFIEGIGEDYMLDCIKRSKPGRTWGRHLLSKIHQVHQEFGKQLKNKITPSDWINTLIRGNLYRIVRVLFHDRNKPFIVDKLKSLSERGEFDDRISKGTVDDARRLMRICNYINQRVSSTDPDVLSGIALKLAANVNLKSEFNTEELTFLVSEICEKCKTEDACQILIDKIIQEVKLKSFAQEKLDTHLGLLLKQIHTYGSEEAKTTLNNIINELLSESGSEDVLAVSSIESIWPYLSALLQINYEKASQWIKNQETELWVNKLAEGTSCSAFWLIWIIYQVDENLATNVLHKGLDSLKGVIDQKNEISGENLPLVGLSKFLNHDIYDDGNVASSKMLAVDLYEEGLNVSVLAFSCLALEAINSANVEEFTKDIRILMNTGNPPLSIEELIQIYPFDRTLPQIKKIINRFFQIPSLDIRNNLGELMVNYDDPDQVYSHARSCYRKRKLDDAEWYAFVGKLKHNVDSSFPELLGDIKQAKEQLEKALKYYNESIYIRSGKKDFKKRFKLLVKLGRDEARNEIKTYRGRGRYNTDPEGWTWMGHLYMNEKNYPQAVAEYEEAIRMTEEMYLKAMDEYKDAIKNKAARDLANNYRYLAKVQVLRGQELNEAKVSIMKALEYNEIDFRSKTVFAAIMLLEGEVDSINSSLDLCKTINDKCPDWLPARIIKLCCLAKLGEPIDQEIVELKTCDNVISLHKKDTLILRRCIDELSNEEIKNELGEVIERFSVE